MTVGKRPGGVEIVKIDGRRQRVWRVRLPDGVVWARTDGATARGHSEAEEGSKPSGAAQGSREDLVAQFPGKVRKVLCQEGQTVEEGAALLVVEAMKMEFPVKAPYAGTVQEVRVTEGDILTPGQLMVDVRRSES